MSFQECRRGLALKALKLGQISHTCSPLPTLPASSSVDQKSGCLTDGEGAEEKLAKNRAPSMGTVALFAQEIDQAFG